MDALNPQPRVWPAVAALLRSHFPELLEPVRRMLFDRLCRQAYLAELRTCVAESARNMAWRTVSVGVSEASGGQTKTSLSSAREPLIGQSPTSIMPPIADHAPQEPTEAPSKPVDASDPPTGLLVPWPTKRLKQPPAAS